MIVIARLYGLLPPALLLLLVAGCASVSPPDLPAAGPAVRPPMAGPESPLAAKPVLEIARVTARGERVTDPQEAVGADQDAAGARILKGNDKVVNLPSAGADPVRGENVALRFERAPITEVVHAVLGDMLHLNYTIHQPVAGEVTLHTLAPLPPEQILSVLESLLEANGLAIAQDKAGLYHVGRPEALKFLVPVPRRVGELPAGSSLIVVPLQYVGAAEMADILRPVATPQAFVRVDALRNLLVLAGTRNQLEGWINLVELFDVDLLKGMSVGLFPLHYTSVKEVEAALQLMVGGTSASHGGGLPQAARGSGEGNMAGAMSSFSPGVGSLRVMPIERMNAILIVTPRAAQLEEARQWIEKLDRPDNDASARLFVYPVQNGTAKQLAVLLNGIFGGQASAEPVVARDSGVAPGLATASMSSAKSSGGALPAATAGSGKASGAQGDAQVTQVSIGPGIRVVADDQHNALLIYAPLREYQRIETALRQLDTAPAQVLIEASIVEVSLTDETRYGLQWYFQDNVRGRGWSGVGVLGNGSNGAITAGQSGFSYTIANPLGDVRAVLNLLADKQLLKVISSPSLMVLDNQTAEIRVGDQQPVPGPTTTTDGGTSRTSVEYKDTGVLLKVTPSVNAGNNITMAVDQTVTDVGGIDAATGARSFLQRQISSTVAVPSGETVVLGGLIRDNKSRGKQGVPILHDLPFIGPLFGTTTLNTDRTELLVMITPRVVRTEQDMREVTNEIQDRMRSLKKHLAQQADEPLLMQDRMNAPPWRRPATTGQQSGAQ